MTNGLIILDVAPLHGGRIIQYSLAGHQYLWANPELAGKLPPAEGVGPDNRWLDWGGDKLWPAPQGWDGLNQWPGPPDAVLDGSPHGIEILKDRDEAVVGVELLSQKDPRSGIQFGRTIHIFGESSIVRIRATMTNVDTKPRRWGIWTTTQLRGSGPDGNSINPKLRAYIPINPKSHFPGGFSVLYGSADNPQFKPDSDAGLMRVHYQRKVGKIGMDSPAGWAATVDGVSGFVFVQGFSFQPGREYPDGSSVEYWTNGLGAIKAWGSEIEMPADTARNPYVVESELISPFADLQPGEQCRFDYEWRACRIGGDFEISACSPVGCTAEALRLERRDGRGHRLLGRFGVFHAGKVRVSFRDIAGSEIAVAGPPVMPVTPAKPLLLEEVFQPVDVPPSAAVVVLSIHDLAGARIGDLATTPVSK